jgi:hypothetical protein
VTLRSPRSWCSVAEGRAYDREVAMNGKGGELSSFLQKLSEDKGLQQEYMSDPEGTMRQAGVSDEAIQAALSRDPQRIKAVLDRELGDVSAMLFMVITEPSV